MYTLRIENCFGPQHLPAFPNCRVLEQRFPESGMAIVLVEGEPPDDYSIVEVSPGDLVSIFETETFEIPDAIEVEDDEDWEDDDSN